MKNVLIVYERLEPCSQENIRVFGILESKGLLKMKYCRAFDVSADLIVWSDVLLLVRSTSSLEYDLSKLYQKLGKTVLLVLDDDFLSLGSDYGKDSVGYQLARKNSLIKILGNTDCLIAVNELLAKKYVEIGGIKDYILTNTIIEKKELYIPREKDIASEKIKIALYVNDGSCALFESIIKPVLPKLCLKYPHRLELYLMALHPDLQELNNIMDIIYVPHMPYADFKTYLGTQNFDFGLAPLVNEGFSRYKYFNKYVEYTLAGIPAIYSDCELYRLVINNNFNGLLCQNSVEDWCESISRLIDNSDLRGKLINNAQNHIYKNFSEEKVTSKLYEDLIRVFKTDKDKMQLPMLNMRLLFVKARYLLFRMSGWCVTFITYIRKGQFDKLFRRFYKRFICGKNL